MRAKQSKLSDRKSRSGLKYEVEHQKRSGGGRFNWGSYVDDLDEFLNPNFDDKIDLEYTKK
ncbi:hypothetical protein HDU92_004860 [Lobulomyces angularis]|nr:hypothetical protein HDU92_004860 [Lobulomyces angularis]